MAVDGFDMTCKCSAWLHYWARAGRGVWDWLWTRFAVDRLTTEVGEVGGHVRSVGRVLQPPGRGEPPPWFRVPTPWLQGGVANRLG